MYYDRSFKGFHGINDDVMIHKLHNSCLPKIIVRTIGYMLKNTFRLTVSNTNISNLFDVQQNLNVIDGVMRYWLD